MNVFIATKQRLSFIATEIVTEYKLILVIHSIVVAKSLIKYLLPKLVTESKDQNTLVAK